MGSFSAEAHLFRYVERFSVLRIFTPLIRSATWAAESRPAADFILQERFFKMTRPSNHITSRRRAS